jgi:hypothetical protein
VPGAEPDVEAAVGEDVGGDDLAREQRRVPERHVQHERADAQPFGDVRRGHQHRERRGRPEVVGGEQGVEPGALEAPAALLERLPGGDAEDVGGEPEVAGHTATLASGGAAHNRRSRPADQATRVPPSSVRTVPVANGWVISDR